MGSREMLIELVSLYWAICTALFLGIWLKPSPRLWVAAMMASGWQVAALLWLNILAVKAGWWSFFESRWMLQGIPVSLYIGWVVLWGVVAVFLAHIRGTRLGVLWMTIAGLALFDLVVMPQMNPVLILGDYWLIGEFVLLFGSLLPGMLLARWVLMDRYVEWRAAMISSAFVVILLGVCPLAGGDGYDDFLSVWRGRESWMNWGISGLVFFAGVPALAGVRQFVISGRGTPIPFDPPKTLVSEGVYGYCANPMQLSMAAVLIFWALLWHSWVSLGLAVVSVAYAQGLAKWSETEDLKRRHGKRWLLYQSVVPRWRFRIFPYLSPDQDRSPARLYVASRCDVCSEVRHWFSMKESTGLMLCAAEDYPGHPLDRITYISASGEVQARGIDAVACAFQHLHVGWAYLGWLMQFPGIMQILQLAMDTSGAGKFQMDGSAVKNEK